MSDFISNKESRKSENFERFSKHINGYFLLPTIYIESGYISFGKLHTDFDFIPYGYRCSCEIVYEYSGAVKLCFELSENHLFHKDIEEVSFSKNLDICYEIRGENYKLDNVNYDHIERLTKLCDDSYIEDLFKGLFKLKMLRG